MAGEVGGPSSDASGGKLRKQRIRTLACVGADSLGSRAVEEIATSGEISARSRLLYRFLLREADELGFIDVRRGLELSLALPGYGPVETAELQRAGLIEPHEGGWLVPLKELLARG